LSISVTVERGARPDAAEDGTATIPVTTALRDAMTASAFALLVMVTNVT
jgi:hypothetical protein